MKYAVILLSSLLLTSCATSTLDGVPVAKKLTATSSMAATQDFVADPKVLALNAQLQRVYASSPVQVLKVGNELKVTYPSDALFGVGGIALLPSACDLLDPLLSAVQEDAQATIRIDCFTDNSGSPEKNVWYTEKRAQSVASYLTGRGLLAGNLSQKGYGSDYPVASNASFEGRMQNRRVVITIKIADPTPSPVLQRAV